MDLLCNRQTLIITDGSSLYAAINQKVRHYANEWGIEYDFERLYDWLVTEAIVRNLQCHTSNHIKIDNRVHHDLYKCVYNDILNDITLHVGHHIRVNRLNFLNCASVKILVTFRELVFVRTYQDM